MRPSDTNRKVRTNAESKAAVQVFLGTQTGLPNQALQAQALQNQFGSLIQCTRPDQSDLYLPSSDLYLPSSASHGFLWAVSGLNLEEMLCATRRATRQVPRPAPQSSDLQHRDQAEPPKHRASRWSSPGQAPEGVEHTRPRTVGAHARIDFFCCSRVSNRLLTTVYTNT